MTEFEKALGESKPLLLVIYSPENERSMEMLPVVEEVRKSMGDRANVVNLNGTDNQEVVREYKVASYPAYLLFKDGQVAWRDYGVKKYSELEHMVREFI